MYCAERVLKCDRSSHNLQAGSAAQAKLPTTHGLQLFCAGRVALMSLIAEVMSQWYGSEARLARANCKAHGHASGGADYQLNPGERAEHGGIGCEDVVDTDLTA